MIVEIRYKTNKERDRLLASLNEIVVTSYIEGTKSTLDGLIQRDVMESNEQQEIFIKQLEEITSQKIPTEKRGGVSDANHVSSCGVITLDGFGPFGDGDHTKKERALKDTFEQRINMMTNILKFFHSEKNGGISSLKFFNEIFQDISFIPTGGVTIDNCELYLRENNVLAVGSTSF